MIPGQVRFASTHRVTGEGDTVGVVNEPVEDGVGIGRVADHVVPALDRDLGGQDGGGALMAIPGSGQVGPGDRSPPSGGGAARR